MKLLSLITCASIGLFAPALRAASTPAQIIAEYVKSESALKSRHVISENIAEISDTDAPGKKRFSKYVIESKTDGTRHEIRSLYWDLPRPDAPALDEKALTQSVLWDGAVGYEFHQIPGHPEANFLAIITDKEWIPKRLRGGDMDRLLIGFLGGDEEPISSILRSADRVDLHQQPEVISNSPCHVLDVTSGKYGSYTLWIDPDHGHNIARASLKKGAGQLFFNKPLPQAGDAVGRDDVLQYSATLDNIRFEKSGDLWLPMSVDYERISVAGSKDRIYTVRGHHRRTKVQIAPAEVNADDAFKPIFPNGTRVFDAQNRNAPPRKWQDGKIVNPSDEKNQ